MSQKAVESLLGRLITDQQFRRRFYLEPTGVCVGENLDITARELDAVLGLDEARIAEFARSLDMKIVRAAVEPMAAGSNRPEKPLTWRRRSATA